MPLLWERRSIQERDFVKSAIIPHSGMESQYWTQASEEIDIKSFVLCKNRSSYLMDSLTTYTGKVYLRPILQQRRMEDARNFKTQGRHSERTVNWGTALLRKKWFHLTLLCYLYTEAGDDATRLKELDLHNKRNEWTKLQGASKPRHEFRNSTSTKAVIPPPHFVKVSLNTESRRRG